MVYIDGKCTYRKYSLLTDKKMKVKTTWGRIA